jgi:hypothetical protein
MMFGPTSLESKICLLKVGFSKTMELQKKVLVTLAFSLIKDQPIRSQWHTVAFSYSKNTTPISMRPTTIRTNQTNFKNTLKSLLVFEIRALIFYNRNITTLLPPTTKSQVTRVSGLNTQINTLYRLRQLDWTISSVHLASLDWYFSLLL